MNTEPSERSNTPDSKQEALERGCFEGRVMNTDEWIALHAGHGHYSKQRAEYQPPRGTYTIYKLVCPCGAKHIVTEDGTK